MRVTLTPPPLLRDRLWSLCSQRGQHIAIIRLSSCIWETHLNGACRHWFRRAMICTISRLSRHYEWAREKKEHITYAWIVPDENWVRWSDVWVYTSLYRVITEEDYVNKTLKELLCVPTNCSISWETVWNRSILWETVWSRSISWETVWSRNVYVSDCLNEISTTTQVHKALLPSFRSSRPLPPFLPSFLP